MDTRRRNPELLAAQIQISIPNKYLGCGYKGLGCFQLANILRAVIDHMICYNLNWPKIKL